jgi:hypothetical protein
MRHGSLLRLAKLLGYLFLSRADRPIGRLELQVLIDRNLPAGRARRVAAGAGSDTPSEDRDRDHCADAMVGCFTPCVGSSVTGVTGAANRAPLLVPETEKWSEKDCERGEKS